MTNKRKVLAVVGVLAAILMTKHHFKEPVYNMQKLDKLPKFGDFAKTEPVIFSPVVLLLDEEGKPFCSGTVIDNNYVLTAAHCLTDQDLRMSKEIIYIASNQDVDIKTKAKAVAIDVSLDFGLVKGDFRDYEIMPSSFTTFLHLSKGPFVACGFPLGQKTLICEPIVNLVPHDFKYVAYDQLVQGMSGGPVLDLSGELPTVVAVNTAVDGDINSRPSSNIILSPIMGLLGDFEIEPLAPFHQ